MYWFGLRLSDKLYNRFVNIIDVININNLISRLRNIDLRIKQKKDYQSSQASARNKFIITRTNKNRNITRKLTSRFEVYNNKLINYITKRKTSFETKLVFWFQTFKNKIKKKNLYRKCLRSKHCFNYFNISCKNESAKIKEKAIIELKTYNISNLELATLKEESSFNISNNNLDNFSELKN